MPQALLTLIVVVGVLLFFIVLRIVGGMVANGQLREAERNKRSWNDVDKTEELIGLYLDMVFRHGPDSQEAKAFRFGVDNKEFWQGSALATFQQICDHVDAGIRRNAESFISWKKQRKHA